MGTRRLEALPEITNVNLSDKVNPVYLPHLLTVHEKEVYYGGSGSGKCFAKGTKVVMFSGELKAVEDVVVGDLLMGPDSNPRKVLSLSQGVGQLYKVHQCKGIDYVVNEQHVLCLKKSIACKGKPNQKRRYPNYEQYVEISVKDYLEKTNRWKRNFNGYRTAIEFPKTSVPIDPYFLGIWLGDGTKANLNITTADPEIVDYLNIYTKSVNQELVIACNAGNATTYRIKGTRGRYSKGKGEVLEEFQNLGLLFNKHIPDVYLHNTREIRLQVLAGIIDTDGHSTRNCYDIVQKNKILAYQIKYLCNSLGLRCSLYEIQKTCTNNGVVGTYYRSSISGDLTKIPVKIERKKIKSCGIPDPDVSGITVTKDIVGEYYGFEVDSDNKFLLEDFTVTHNSTFVGGQKLPLQLTMYEGRNLVCLRSQKSDCLASCWAEVYNGLDKLGLIGYWEIKQNPVHKMINRIYGNEILFEGLDNIEDIKSIKFTRKGSKVGDANVTDIWYEEVNAEPNKEVIEELVRRLRDPEIKCRLILTFNPVTRTHWLYDYVMHDLQLPGVDSLILKTTYLDNKFLPPSYGEDLKRLQYTNPYAYQVYCLGDWGTTGQTVFDANLIQKRLDELKIKYAHEPYTTGQFDYQTDANGMPLPDTYSFFETKKGKINIYEKPQPRVPYVLAVDTAGDGSDFYVGHIRNNITGAQVAVFRDNKTPDLCVWQLFGLAKMYNDALLGPEINFNAWIITAFQLLGYDNFYRRTTAADRTTSKTERKYGWVTGANNRMTMLTELVRWTKTNMHLINDVETLNEMLLFTVQEKARGLWWGAEPGAHDDNVMCAAIMLQVCGQQFCEMTAEIEKVTGYWTQGELNIAVKEGRVVEEAAREYMQEHPERFKKYARGVSRYAR